MFRICSAYEAAGGPSKLGRWYTEHALPSEMQLQIDAAVKPVWKSTETGKISGRSPADFALAVRIPKGTIVMRGPVASQGEAFLGGANMIQLYIPEVRQTPGVAIVSRQPFIRSGPQSPQQGESK